MEIPIKLTPQISLQVLHVCRICLLHESNVPFIEFFSNEGKFYKNIQLLANVRILPHSNIPTLICDRCIDNLEKAIKFRKMIIKAMTRYNELLERNYCDPLKTELGIDESNTLQIAEIKNIISIENDNFEEIISEMSEEVNEEVVEPEEEYLEDALDKLKQIIGELPLISENNDQPSKSENEIKQKSEKLPQKPEPAPQPTKKSRKSTHQVLQCPQCGKKMISHLELQDHLLEMHSKKKVWPKRNPERHRKPTPKALDRESDYQCIYCEKYFAKAFDLMLHRRRIHEAEEKSLTCPHCQKVCQSVPHLRAHISSNHTLKRFMCELCGRKFSCATEYADHVRLEKGELDFECDICGLRYHSRGRLMDHMNFKHLPPKTFCCEYEGCGLKVNSRRNLRNHINIVHLNNKKQECDICQKIFYQLHAMNRHKYRVHFIPWDKKKNIQM